MDLPAWMLDPTVPQTICALLALPAVVLSLDGPRWDRRELRIESEEAALQAVLPKFRNRPGDAIYDWVPALALASTAGSVIDPLVRRAEAALMLPEPARAMLYGLARQWISAAGDFARESTESEPVSHRKFMATFHLAVIRDASVAVPALLAMNHEESLSAHEQEMLPWAIATWMLALRYNTVARQQREPVFVYVKRLGSAYGPLADRPGPALRRLSSVFDRLPLRYKYTMLLRFRARLRFNRWAKRLAAVMV